MSRRHRPCRGLGVLLVELRDRGLAGDAQDRDRVGGGGVQAGDHVGAGGAGGPDADTDVAGLRTGVALGHVRRALDVAGERVAERAVSADRRVERVDRGTGQAEQVGHALLAQNRDGGVDCPHAGHGASSQEVWDSPARPESSSTDLNRAEWSRPPWPCAFSEAMSCATAAPSGMTTPASRAALVTMPMSLWCSAIRKPGAKFRESMLPALRCNTVLPASPPPSTLTAASVSTWCASRKTIASARSSMLPATMSWLAALTVWPEPDGPTCTMVAPTTSKTGAASVKSSAAPPTMIDKLPSIAPASPPETGASSTRRPRAAPTSAIRRETSGRIVEKSITRAPSRALSKTPSSPVSTSSTSGESGTMTAMTSAPLTASAMLPAPRPPAAATASIAAGSRL